MRIAKDVLYRKNSPIVQYRIVSALLLETLSVVIRDEFVPSYCKYLHNLYVFRDLLHHLTMPVQRFPYHECLVAATVKTGAATFMIMCAVAHAKFSFM